MVWRKPALTVVVAVVVVVFECRLLVQRNTYQTRIGIGWTNQKNDPHLG